VVVAPEDERGQGGEIQIGSNGRMFMVAFELCCGGAARELSDQTCWGPLLTIGPTVA
jgi:hypothetical protein